MYPLGRRYLVASCAVELPYPLPAEHRVTVALMCMKAREHSQRKSSRSRSYWQGMARRPQRTPQEIEVTSMLSSVGFSHKEQWVLEACGEGLIFDFFIEERILVECTYSAKAKCWSAWGWLKCRATYHDYKFRLAKEVGTFITISLLENTGKLRSGAPRKFPYPQTVSNLLWTDHVVSSVLSLGELLIRLGVKGGSEARPIIEQEGLDQWLATGTHPKHRKLPQKG